MDLGQFKNLFVEEAHGLLSSLDDALVDLEKKPWEIGLINEAFRVMHTIKGAAGMYGFSQIVEVTHELESLYDHIRQNKIQVPPELINLTFQASDHIRALLEDEAFEIEANIARHAGIKSSIENLRDIGSSKIPADTGVVRTGIDPTRKMCTWNIVFYPDDGLIKRAVNIKYIFQDLAELGECQISSLAKDQNGKEFYSIFLVTEQPYEEIEGALIFVMDYCRIIRVSDFNLFDMAGLEERLRTGVQALDKNFEEVSPVTADQSKGMALFNKGDDREQADSVSSSDRPLLVNVKHGSSRINVDASKLDQLMYLVSELVTTKSELRLAIEKENQGKVADASEKIEKLSKLLSENALNIRLVSLSEMLMRFKRLIRDLSKHLLKEVDFITVGDDTELDKNIIDNIGEPLMHLIRNCLDHGIETPERRRERGKPERGQIRFEAVKAGNYVYITIRDDGNGIDTEYVYKKAVDNGFVQPGSGLTTNEIYDLIFLPGFSTAQSLTDISGRGVGMDIVKRKIQEIRGEISVASEKGKGASFTLKLQQSVSIIETLLVEAGDLIYALPVEDIEACILESAENFVSSRNHQIGYGGHLIPYIRLRESFSQFSVTGDITEKIIVINRINKKYAIIVDRIIGEYQAVIKPVGEAFSHLQYLSGASLLGDGGIALLLDTDKLWYEIPTLATI